MKTKTIEPPHCHAEAIADTDNSRNSSTTERPDPDPRSRLVYHPPDILEMLRNADILAGPPRDYVPHREYEYLRDVRVDLEQAKLTDKQMMAVSLVFYGRLKKKHAARIMKITKQSLDDHIQLALRKIENFVR
ncbi:MAG: hypothetical protein ACE5G9_14090 [Nitrospinales bacterium]